MHIVMLMCAVMLHSRDEDGHVAALIVFKSISEFCLMNGFCDEVEL